MLTFLSGAYIGIGLSYAYEMLYVANLDIEAAKKELGITKIAGEHYKPLIAAFAVTLFWLPWMLFFKPEIEEDSE